MNVNLSNIHTRQDTLPPLQIDLKVTKTNKEMLKKCKNANFKISYQKGEKAKFGKIVEKSSRDLCAINNDTKLFPDQF